METTNYNSFQEQNDAQFLTKSTFILNILNFHEKILCSGWNQIDV